MPPPSRRPIGTDPRSTSRRSRGFGPKISWTRTASASSRARCCRPFARRRWRCRSPSWRRRRPARARPEARGFGGFRPPSRQVTGQQSGPMQNNFMRSSFVGSGNYGWAVQRLSRAAALAAVHWKNPKAYRAELCGRKDPEDEREEEIQIRVLGKMGGESLSVSLRESASRRDASHRFEDGWRPQDQGDIMLTELEPLREDFAS
ncbi:unnamed protein product [Effrenium voratum]|uniref:Uncharacterized protein n=1 Tax=Effrenium voratum TaxID=2562239 RepID=A0AA36MN60_9DINO|nr:unnamed protein product [Effrenium voratum]